MSSEADELLACARARERASGEEAKKSSSAARLKSGAPEKRAHCVQSEGFARTRPKNANHSRRAAEWRGPTLGLCARAARRRQSGEIRREAKQRNCAAARLKDATGARRSAENELKWRFEATDSKQARASLLSCLLLSR